MKKTMAWLLAMVLLLGVGLVPSALATETETVAVTPFTPKEDSIGIQRGTSLTVGSTTMAGGHFGTEFFSNNTSDMDVRSLLHGYSTVAWTHSLSLAMNGAVISSVDVKPQADGSRTYTLQLQQGLTYNNGTPVTAQDYVFGLLLMASPQLRQVGGTAAGLSHLVGFEQYQSGQSSTFAGVRLLSDTSFSMQVSAEYLPYFYGIAILTANPYPISVIAPGCEVVDNGSGASIAASADAASLSGMGYTPGVFSAEMLNVTLLDPQGGYEYFPQVTTGPYAMESYDATTNTATFVINEQFKGNYEGQKPHIERITLKHVRNETMMDQIQAGEIDLLNKVSNTDSISRGQQMGMQQASYLRSGLAFISFSCEQGPTASAAVRKAIALSIDKDSIMARALDGTARRVYGYYGLGQWMLGYETQKDSAWSQGGTVEEEMKKLDLPKNIDAAIDLLVADGWSLNEAGRVYIQGSDGVRYREGANGLEPLEIKWAKMQDSAVANIIEQELTEGMRAIGARLVVTEMPLNQLLSHYYRNEDRTYDMFYLASNFMYVFDPYYDFNTSDAYQGLANKTGLKDEELMQLALELRETQPTDLPAYMQKWLAFQQRFAELLPLIPLYSNVYYDFYSQRLQGYEIASQTGWGYAIPYAWIQE